MVRASHGPSNEVCVADRTLGTAESGTSVASSSDGVLFIDRRFDRRFRVYDISDFGETIKTYKRSEHDDVLDELVLAGRGAAPYNS